MARRLGYIDNHRIPNNDPKAAARNCNITTSNNTLDFLSSSSSLSSGVGCRSRTPPSSSVPRKSCLKPSCSSTVSSSVSDSTMPSASTTTSRRRREKGHHHHQQQDEEQQQQQQQELNEQQQQQDASGALNDPPGSSTPTVRFSVVEIREYERCVGDNPSCSSGVPISIGWNHGRTYAMMLEDFESARPSRRAQLDLVLTRGERHRLLMEWGAAGQDVIEAIRNIIRVKNQRRQTVNNLGSYDRIEEVFEKFMRNTKRIVFRSSANTEAKRLQEASERAARIQKGQVDKTSSFTVSDTLTAPYGGSDEDRAKMGRSNHSGSFRKKNQRPPCSEVEVVKNHSCSHCEASDMERAPPAVSEDTSSDKKHRHHHQRIEMKSELKVTERTSDGSKVVEKVESTAVILEKDGSFPLDVDDLDGSFSKEEEDQQHEGAAMDGSDGNGNSPSDISESAQSGTGTDEGDYRVLSPKEAAEKFSASKRYSEANAADDDVDNMSNPQSQEHSSSSSSQRSDNNNNNNNNKKGKKIRQWRRRTHLEDYDDDDNATAISI